VQIQLLPQFIHLNNYNTNMKTRYRNHKTFKDQAKAKKMMEKLQKEMPGRTFTIKRRKFHQSEKTRYTLRSV
jgi:hypothetical protein